MVSWLHALKSVETGAMKKVERRKGWGEILAAEGDSLEAQMVKKKKKIYLQCKRPGSNPSGEDLLEKEMATHSGILAWEIS